MNGFRWVLCVCALGLSLAASAADGPSATPESPTKVDRATAEAAAETAALAWLAIVDAGNYEESYDQAAKLFRAAIGKADWVHSLGAVRSPLGKNLGRTVVTRNYRTSAPGAPDGHYVVLQIRTSFTDKETAMEIVTPMLEDDGSWRVSGYYIN